MFDIHSKMYEEACRRMKALGINEETIELFRNNKLPVSLHTHGICNELSADQMKACDALMAEGKESETKYIVYLLQHGEENGCTVEYLLFVDDYEDDWNSFYEELKELPFITLYVFYPQQGFGKYADGLFVVEEGSIPHIVNLDAAANPPDDSRF